MELTADDVQREFDWVIGRADRTVSLINGVRNALSAHFDMTVDPVTPADYREEVSLVFADGDLAINVTAIIVLLRDLDVADDYPGFIVDELLGRELAGMIAGNQPLRLLGEATFHYADVHVDGNDSTEWTVGDQDSTAGIDDLDAALAAGFQSRLPGWEWTETPSPFGVVEAGSNGSS